MALLFDAATERVECGSPAELDDVTVGSMLAWVWFNDLSLGRWRFKKAAGEWNNHQEMYCTDADYYFLTQYTTQNLYINAGAVLTTGKWWFLGASWDENGADADQKLWIGDLSTFASEPGSYANQDAPTGTIGSNASGTFKIGNRYGDDRSFEGYIAWLAFWNGTPLDIDEVRLQQFDLSSPRVALADCVIFMHLGLTGTGTQADWSGGANNGTITGATLTPHVPLPLHPFDQALPYTVTPAGVTVPTLYYHYAHH